VADATAVCPLIQIGRDTFFYNLGSDI